MSCWRRVPTRERTVLKTSRKHRCTEKSCSERFMQRKRFVRLRLVVFSVSSFVSVSCVSPSVSTAHRASRADGFEHSLCPSRHGSSPLQSRARETQCIASALGFVTSTSELHHSLPLTVIGELLLVEVLGLHDTLNIHGSVQQLERSGVFVW